MPLTSLSHFFRPFSSKGNFDNLYCSDVLDNDGILQAIPWGSGTECTMHSGTVKCTNSSKRTIEDIRCPQLPLTSPFQLARNGSAVFSSFNLPPGWTCAPEKFYEWGRGLGDPTCDCEW